MHSQEGGAACRRGLGLFQPTSGSAQQKHGGAMGLDENSLVESKCEMWGPGEPNL